jgi:hypothetical protein
MERVERIEDLDVRAFRAQGTVDAGGAIRTSTAWCQPGALLPAARAGCIPSAPGSFCRKPC